jgi:hypothetical protein
MGWGIKSPHHTRHLDSNDIGLLANLQLDILARAISSEKTRAATSSSAVSHQPK